MRAKILGAFIIALVLVLGSILAYNWKTIVPATTQTVTAIASSQATTTITQSSPTKILSMMGKVKVPTNGCYLGAWAGHEDITKFESMIGKKLAMRNVYYAWGYGFPSKALESMMKFDMILVLSWNIALHNPAIGRANLPIKLQDIIDGKYDNYLTEWARSARAFGNRILLNPGYGMNGEWMLWGGANNFGKYSNQSWRQADDLNKYYGHPLKPDGPERFVDAWRHIHNIFKQQEVSNVEWLWTTTDPGPDLPWNSSENYYPGDEYVGWVGCFIYNFGYFETESGIMKAWQDFETRFENHNPAKVYTKYSHKPFMITEISCSQERMPGVSGDKASWISDALTKIKTKYRNIKAVMWFHEEKKSQGERDWRVDSSPEALEAYRKAISDPYFLDRIMFETSSSTPASSPYSGMIAIPLAASFSKIGSR